MRLLALLIGLLTTVQIQAQHLKVLSYNIHHANPPSKPDAIDLEAIARVINDSGLRLSGFKKWIFMFHGQR